MKVLGIDPGIVCTGYGIVLRAGSSLTPLAHGTIRLGTGPMEDRLKRLFEGLTAVVKEHQPSAAAVEGVFQAKNARSALSLGHARGVALLVAALNGIPVVEYAPAVVKQAVTSFGRAEKIQVQRMVSVLLGLDQIPQSDAADALAVAICHAQTMRPPRQRQQA